MDPEHQRHLEHALSQQGLLEVERTVHDHGAELQQQHHQEGLGHRVLRQRLREVHRTAVFLGDASANRSRPRTLRPPSRSNQVADGNGVGRFDPQKDRHVENVTGLGRAVYVSSGFVC